ncbi:DUF2635 domain-containing protein [Enterobacter asburiae]
MMVTARPGLKVPLEDDARRYITDGESVDVPENSAYYLRRLSEGDLVPAAVRPPVDIQTEPAMAAAPEDDGDGTACRPLDEED